MSAQLPKNLPDYSSQGRGVLILFVTLTSLSVIGRIVSRIVQRNKLALDDYFAYLAFLSNLGQLVSGLLLIHKGTMSLLGLAEASDADILYITNTFVALGAMYSAAILFIKLSVLFLYRRIFTMNNKWFRIAWWINLIFLFPLWTTAAFTLLGVQVAHKNLQNSQLSHIGTPAIGAFNALSDLMLLVLPVGSIRHLHLPKKQRMALMGVFGVGLIATCVSISRAIMLEYDKPNPAYENYTDILMTAAETSAGLMCACLPVTKPILIKANDLAARTVTEMASLITRTRTKGSGSSSQASKSDATMNSRHQGGRINRTYDYEVDVIPLTPKGESRGSSSA